MNADQKEFMRSLARWQGVATSQDLGPQTRKRDVLDSSHRDLARRLADMGRELDEARAAISAFVAGWDLLPAGDTYYPHEVQRWLNNPAMRDGVLGLKRINEQQIPDGQNA